MTTKPWLETFFLGSSQVCVQMRGIVAIGGAHYLEALWDSNI